MRKKRCNPIARMSSRRRLRRWPRFRTNSPRRCIRKSRLSKPSQEQNRDLMPEAKNPLKAKLWMPSLRKSRTRNKHHLKQENRTRRRDTAERKYFCSSCGCLRFGFMGKSIWCELKSRSHGLEKDWEFFPAQKRLCSVFD